MTLTTWWNLGKFALPIDSNLQHYLVATQFASISSQFSFMVRHCSEVPNFLYFNSFMD